MTTALIVLALIVGYKTGVRRGKARFAKASVLRRIACSHIEDGVVANGGYPARKCTCVQ